MSREEAASNLKAMGIEPTKEQIDSYLNTINGAIKQEKDRADKYKAEADKVADLQSKLDEINNQSLSEVDKVNKALQKAEADKAELNKRIIAMENKAKLAELGITGKNADELIGENGINFDVLGQILSEKATAAATAKEAELAGSAGNPSGAGTGGNEDLDGEGARYAKQFSAQYNTEINNGGN